MNHLFYLEMLLDLQRLSPLLIIGTIVQVKELGNLVVMQTM